MIKLTVDDEHVHSVFRGSVIALIGSSSPVWDTSRVSKCVSVDMVPGADEVIKRVLEGQQHDGD